MFVDTAPFIYVLESHLQFAELFVGLFEAADQETVERALKANIYWRHGIWTALEVYPWIQAF